MTQFVNNYPWLADDYLNLAGQSNRGAFPQSLIISGREGVGKNVFIDAIIKYHLCLSDSIKPCGQCQSCQWIASEFHPDLKIVALEKESKQIKVDQIREMIEFCHRASETGKKVVVIKDADKLNINAANSVLKILEEPMEDVTIVLVTAFPKRLPMTILSRCQKLSLKSDNYQYEVAYIDKNCPKISDEQLEIVTFLYKGAPLLATSFILEEGELFYKKLLAFFLFYIENKEISEEFIKLMATSPAKSLYIIILWLREILIGNVSGREIPHLSSLREIAQENSDDKKLVYLYEKLVKSMELIDSNIKYDWLIENILKQ